MGMKYLKLTNALQAKITHAYKITKEWLHRNYAAI